MSFDIAELMHGSMQVVIAAESPYFEGHFPGDPILPAVAQILLLETLLRFSHGNGAWISGLSHARFVRPIRPGERIAVRIFLDLGFRTKGVHISEFTIKRGAQEVSGGSFLWHSGLPA